MLESGYTSDAIALCIQCRSESSNTEFLRNACGDASAYSTLRRDAYKHTVHS